MARSLSISDVNSNLKNGNFKTVKNSSKKSDVWEQFYLIINSETSQGTGFVQCSKCKSILTFVASKTGTSHLRRHKCCADSKSSDIKGYFHFDKKNIPSNVKDQMTKKIVEFCAKDIRPFEVICGDGFISLAQTLIEVGAKYGNISVHEILPHPTTVSRHVSAIKNSISERIFPELKAAFSRGCAATTDMWTDDYRKTNYLCLTLHYLSTDWELQKRVLFTADFASDKRKTGDNIRRELLKRFISFGFSEEDFNNLIFVTDQGSNILNALQNHERFNCAAHVLNTVLRNAFDTKFLEEKASSIYETFIGCKDIVTYLKQSGHIKQLPRTICQEIETRWNSKLSMLFSIKDQLSDIEHLLLSKHESHRMDSIDKKVLNEIVSLLQPFKDASDDLESDIRPTFHRVLLWYHRLSQFQSDNSCKTPEIREILSRISNYLQIKFLPTMKHKVATFLSPRFRHLRMLSEKEKIEVLEYIKIETENLKFNAPSSNIGKSNKGLQLKKIKRDIFSEWEDTEITQTQLQKTEIEEYMELDNVSEDDILLWWKTHEKKFPKLAIIARKILCIPASSASSERNFSTAGRLYEERRTNLKPEILDSLLFLHDNM